jgi:hypothetical protein
VESAPLFPASYRSVGRISEAQSAEAPNMAECPRNARSGGRRSGGYPPYAAARLRSAAILCRAAPFIVAAPFVAIMIVGALVLVE